MHDNLIILQSSDVLQQGYQYSMLLCKVAISWLSSIKQSASSTFDWVMNSQSEFDWVEYKQKLEFSIAYKIHVTPIVTCLIVGMTLCETSWRLFKPAYWVFLVSHSAFILCIPLITMLFHFIVAVFSTLCLLGFTDETLYWLFISGSQVTPACNLRVDWDCMWLPYPYGALISQFPNRDKTITNNLSQVSHNVK